MTYMPTNFDHKRFTADQVLEQYPFLDKKYGDPEMTSKKYAPINSMEVVRKLETCGYKTYNVIKEQSYKRNSEYARHMILMDNPEHNINGTNRSAIIMNSYNGLKSFQLADGALRGACFNTQFFGEVVNEIKFRHYGETTREFDVDDHINEFMLTANDKFGIVETMSNIRMSPLMTRTMKAAVTKIKPGTKNITAMSLFEPTRNADNDNTLYTKFNIIQEKIQRGMLVNPDSKRKIPAIKGLYATEQMNIELFEAAKQCIKLAA